MSSLITRSIMDARAAAALPPRNELLSLAEFIADVGAIGLLEAQERQLRLVVSHVDPSLAVEVDRDLLMSAVMNLLTNAFKFTCQGTEVTQGSGDRSGLGLGLAISRRNVEAQSGTLTVRDIPGTGCVFTIKLP